ncbi:unnamed protein product, partial [Mesorhabditis belari]|uniref:Saposin B-type domain-containing protein n=1 Tax=Mesorhabditis belari TaxID=2138241 RepID=A0AAF3FJC0_9BILA
MKLILLAAVSMAVVFGQMTTTAPTADPCQMCDYIMNQARHHLNNGYDEPTLLKELLNDCQSLGRFYGQQAVRDCQDTCNQNIDTIYKDLKAGKDAWQVCYDLHACFGTEPTHQSHPHTMEPKLKKKYF